MTSSALLYFALFLLVKSSVIFQHDQGNRTCTCVPFYQCSDEENGVVISDGRGLIEVRQFAKNEVCKGYFDICCNVTAPLASSEPPIKPQGCGTQKTNHFPWSASLFFKDAQNSPATYKCGVSLIHEKVAITAAHCLNQKGFYLVRIGNVIKTITKTFTHPEFKRTSLRNDIAVLFLNRPFKFSEKLGPVCLPPPGSVLKSENCTAATWLSKHQVAEKRQENLKTIHLPVVAREDCTEMLRETRLGKLFRLHHSFMCAGGGEEMDTCGGDGGSPLICPVPGLPGKFQQAGIVSWGIGCGRNIPGVYVNLAIFRDWIDAIMLSNELDINTYRY